MARYLVMKRDNDIEVVKEEQSQIVSLSLLTLLKSWYLLTMNDIVLGLLTIGILMRRVVISRVLIIFGTFAVIQLMISWDFLSRMTRMMD